jgi:hypothetical protein
MSDERKISELHRRRRAVVYVRQSARCRWRATWNRPRASMRCGTGRWRSAGRPGRSRALTRTRPFGGRQRGARRLQGARCRGGAGPGWADPRA